MKHLFPFLFLLHGLDIHASVLETIQKEWARLEPLTTREAETRKAELLFWKTQYADDDKDKESALSKGMEIIERELLDAPKNAALIYWWIALEGERVQRGSKLLALKGIETLERRAKELKQIDPGYGAGAADRILGHLYHVAPWGISIGSSAKARIHLKAAFDRDPAYPANRLYWGRFLGEGEDKATARALIAGLLEPTALDKFPLEKTFWEKSAREAWQKFL